MRPFVRVLWRLVQVSDGTGGGSSGHSGRGRSRVQRAADPAGHREKAQDSAGEATRPRTTTIARHQVRTSVPIQLAQCRFPGLAVSIARILMCFFFSNKIYGSSFVKQHSETVFFETTKMLIVV